MCYYSYRPNYANIAKDKKDPNLSSEKKEMIQKVENLDKNSKNHRLLGEKRKTFLRFPKDNDIISLKVHLAIHLVITMVKKWLNVQLI